MRIGVGEDEQLAAAGADFVQIAFQFFDERVVWRDGEDGHRLRHQSKRAVFEYACGVGFGLDELMVLCDPLEAQLTQSQTDSHRLLEAVLEAALTSG